MSPSWFAGSGFQILHINWNYAGQEPWRRKVGVTRKEKLGKERKHEQLDEDGESECMTSCVLHGEFVEVACSFMVPFDSSSPTRRWDDVVFCQIRSDTAHSDSLSGWRVCSWSSEKKMVSAKINQVKIAKFSYPNYKPHVRLSVPLKS